MEQKISRRKIHRETTMNISLSEKITRAIVLVIFTLFAASYIYLVFWCFYTGTREANEIARNAFSFTSMDFSHYGEVFTLFEDENGNNFFDMFLNSMYFAFLGPLLSIFVSCQLAYVTSKYKFFGAGGVYFIVLIVITLPIYGTQTAMYKLLHDLGFINSRLMILTSLNGFTIYYMYFYAFFKSVSWTYGEAAEIDGANEWDIFYRIMLPQSVGMFGSLFLMLWIQEWNSYQTALIYMPKLPTLSVGIYNFKTTMQYYGGRSDLLYAACALSIIPPLVMFIIFNKRLLTNVSIGGIKD